MKLFLDFLDFLLGDDLRTKLLTMSGVVILILLVADAYLWGVALGII